MRLHGLVIALLLPALVLGRPDPAAADEGDAEHLQQLEQKLKRLEQRQKAPKEPKEPKEQVKPLASGLREVSPGVLEQPSSGLQWTQEDNDDDLLWSEALAYCASLPTAKGGWRLPNSTELRDLYDKEARGILCGPGNGECRVSGLFKLKAAYFWSSDNGDLPGTAVIVEFKEGTRYSDIVSYPGGRHALCVRRP